MLLVLLVKRKIILTFSDVFREKNSIKVQTQNGHMVTERIWRVICDFPFRLMLYRSSSHSTVTLNLLRCMPFILVWPVVCTPTASTGLPHTLSALPGSPFGSLVWGFENKTPQYMTFRLVAFVFVGVAEGNWFRMYRFDSKGGKKKRYSLLIQCGGWRCKIHDAWKEIAIAALSFDCLFSCTLSHFFCFSRWGGRHVWILFYFFVYSIYLVR